MQKTKNVSAGKWVALVIALLCSAVGVVNYEALYWDSALTLYFGEVGVKNVSTVTFDTDDHAQVANLIVAEGAVLLKNEKNALPMKGGKISLFGIDNKNGVLQKVLEDEGFTVNPTLAAFYAASSHSSGAGSLWSGLLMFAIPGAMLVLGVVIWAMRRKR